jgi:hypothetical protein
MKEKKNELKRNPHSFVSGTDRPVVLVCEGCGTTLSELQASTDFRAYECRGDDKT